ncbi:MAG TPA: YceI family protein [Rudaea sp.]|jgi:polyisoprenoid-binding protein YceI
MRSRTAARLVYLTVFLAPWAVAAEDATTRTHELDAERSRGDFEVKVLWLVGVHGRFGKVHGTVTVDRAHDSVVADARIDVDTLTMRNHSYEDWAKSDEFFDAQAHPQIHFVSDPVSLERLRDGGAISGMLTLRGIGRHVTFALAPSACPQVVAGDCPVQANGTIRRSDFGMKSRRGTLSDKVELGFSIYLANALPVQGQAQ